MQKIEGLREDYVFMNGKNYFNDEFNFIKETAEAHGITFAEAVEFVKVCTMNRQLQAMKEQADVLTEIRCAISCLR